MLNQINFIEVLKENLINNRSRKRREINTLCPQDDQKRYFQKLFEEKE